MSDIIKIRNGNSWIGIPTMAGAPGAKGEDGVSPTITVNQTSIGHDITITDVNGTQTISVENGHAVLTPSDQEYIVDRTVQEVISRYPPAETNNF